MARLRKFHRSDRVKLMETSPKSLGGSGGGGDDDGGGGGLSAPDYIIPRAHYASPFRTDK